MGKGGSVSSDGSSLYAHPSNIGRARTNSHNVMQLNEGAEVYVTFERQVRQLDKQLRKLCNEARKLGSSAGILSASTHLRDHLGRVLHHFRQNAMNLFPEEIQAQSSDRPTPLKIVRRWRTKHHVNHKTWIQSSTDNVKLKPDELALEFQTFSEGVMTLFDCFSQFPEFVEELPDWTLAEDLRSWADSLDGFDHQYSTLAVQTYLYDSMADIGDRLETLAKHFIPVFTKLGIPTVRASQDHSAANLQNQTIVAGLFASAATSMLQVFGTSVTGALGLNQTIVLLWYMSLIFSVGSAANGLLALSWMQAIYRSPNHHVPWWILVWIKKFPFIFLVLSIACFFIALILLAFTPQQSRATLVIITFLSTASCLGLVAVSGWFICELLVYTHHEGRVWLFDVINRKKDHVVKSMMDWWQPVSLVFVRRRLVEKDIELNDTTADVGEAAVNIGIRRPSHPHSNSNVSFWLGHEMNGMTPSARARHRWHEAIRRIIELQRQRPKRRAAGPSLRFAHITGVPFKTLRFDSIPKLQSMTISMSHQVNERHGALVRSLQFSPNGQFLVTSSWDSQSFVLRVTTPVLCERVLTYPANTGYVHQADWSPEGNKLLTRSNRKLIVWQLDVDENGMIHQASSIVEHQPEAEDRAIRRASWSGDNSIFFSMQGQRVLTINTSGEILRDYPTQHLELRNVCITSDSRWMICVGKYLREEKRIGQKYGIIVWDLAGHRVVKEAPVYHDMSDVALSSDDKSVLVSYENKAPSQLWKLAVDSAGTDLVMRHIYMPQEKTSFAALPSIFGGEHDHLVLRAGTVGDIYVWDRDSAALVYCIKALHSLEGQLTSFAWNRGSSDYMFATGTHDGAIHIWAPGSDEESESERDSVEDSTALSAGLSNSSCHTLVAHSTM
ncbi:hypothetical protein BC835DRAFT_1412585 [Cytidiella melzeri]|nr:hypothetical protein BC835DRAFT_1412585 [Cytidiella melzeri]